MAQVIPSRSRYELLQSLFAWTDQTGDDESELSRHEIRAGRTVLADPRCRKQFRGMEVVEFDCEGRRFWVSRQEFEVAIT